MMSALLWLTFHHFFYVGFVSSGSMLPNIAVGDGVLVLRSLDVESYNYNDFVVFYHPKHAKELWVKRLIAKGGDRVFFENRVLWLNDKRVTRTKHFESLIPSERYRVYSSYLEDNWGPVDVEQGHLFLMGDHRGSSEDSRLFGTVSESLLFGKVIVIFWQHRWSSWFSFKVF